MQGVERVGDVFVEKYSNIWYNQETANNAPKVSTTEVKQAFLSNAISDISSYIQLADTKVSIIMGSLTALLAGILACYEPIADVLSDVRPCSWIGIILCIFTLLFLSSTIGVFVLAF